MADGYNGNGALYFIVGALCTAIAAEAIALSGGLSSSGTYQAQATAPAAPVKTITIEWIETPKVGEHDLAHP